MKLDFVPNRGFINSKAREDVPFNAFTGDSRDWLLERGRPKRRAGSSNYASSATSGVLEGAWSTRCRRLISAVLASMDDGLPAILGLYTNESTKKGTLAFRSRNGAGSWRTPCEEFSTTHYPETGVPNHRVVPMVYRNEYGGLTLHRMNTATHRAHMAAGSRNIMQVGDEIVWGGYDSACMRWNGRFNDGTGTGEEATEIFPCGMIPPLAMPKCTAHENLGTTVGPFKGSNAWFYTVLFENERGELSMFPMPRARGAAWASSSGIGFFIVDESNASDYFSACIYSNIPDGPPGTKFKRLARTTIVDMAGGASSLSTPSLGSIGFFARIPQGVYEYTDTDGNDAALDFDPRITEMISGGLQWAPSSRVIGGFDGHITAGAIRPCPYAIAAAPWANGSINGPIDDDSLYGSTGYFVSVQSVNGDQSVVLRSVAQGAPDVQTDTTVDINDMTLRELMDVVALDGSTTPTTITGATWAVTTGLSTHAIVCALLADMDSVAIGSIIDNTATNGDKFQPFTKVIGKNAITLTLLLDKAPLTAGTAADVTFITYEESGDGQTYAIGPVPGTDIYESCDALLRTYVSDNAVSWSNGGTVITFANDDRVKWITPGMHVRIYSASETPANVFAATTIVTDVDRDAKTVTVSSAALRAEKLGGETAEFGYNTEADTPTWDDYMRNCGFVRMFAQSFPALLPFNLDYLDRWRANDDLSTFTAASPGYAQDGVNTWMFRNRRGAPSSLGKLMALADIGPMELQFYSKGRMLLYNPRTGTTHNDEDYTKQTRSWNRGARSPYAVCAGNGWAVFLSDDGIFGCNENQEHLLSGALYNPTMDVGERGELEHAIAACIAASEGDTDDYRVHMQIHGSVLRVRYHSSSTATYPDREVRYDFSEGVNRTGLAELLQADGSPYPWSTPLTLRVSCSAEVAEADGKHLYGAIDANAGTTNGRIDELDTGTMDGTTAIAPLGYSGLFVPDDLEEVQPTGVYMAASKYGAGLEVALCADPLSEHSEARWDALDFDGNGPDSFGRSVLRLEPGKSLRRAAIGIRIFDDGTGEAPEIRTLKVDVKPVKSTTSSGR